MSETIQISKPIMVDGQMTTTLNVSKATFKDFVNFGKTVPERNPFSNSLEVIWRPATELEVIQRMLKVMCNLNDIEINMLDPETAFEIAGLIQDFLPSLTHLVQTPES